MKDLTTGKEGKLIFQFALPMLMGNVFQQLYNIIDSIIVGIALGKGALASVGASFPIIFVLISLVVGIATGGTIVISQYFGAKNLRKVKLTIDTLFIFLFFASIVVTIVGIVFSEAIFTLLKLPDELVPQATIYLQIYFTGAISFFGFHGTAAILRGLGDSKTPLVFLIISTVLNILLDLLLILVFKWGIEGAAIATVISQSAAFIAAIIYINRNHEIIKFKIFNLKFDKEVFIQSIKIGLPTGLQHSFVALGMMALLRIVNDFGTNVIAAYTAAGRIDSFAVLPAMNFANALSTFVGQNIGANKLNRVIKGFLSTIYMTSIISVVISILAYLFGEELMRLFTKDQDVIDIGVRYLIIVCSFYILFSTMFMLNGLFRGAGDTIIPMFITLFALWGIRIPLSYYLSIRIGVDGIWWGIPAAWFIGFLFTLIYYFTGKWKMKSIIRP